MRRKAEYRFQAAVTWFYIVQTFHITNATSSKVGSDSKSRHVSMLKVTNKPTTFKQFSMGNGGRALHISQLRSRYRLVVKFTLRPLYPQAG